MEVHPGIGKMAWNGKSHGAKNQIPRTKFQIPADPVRGIWFLEIASGRPWLFSDP
jgi:hypothetical protein